MVLQRDWIGCYSGSREITITLGGDESEIVRDPPQGGRTGRIDPVGKDRTGGGLPPAECADPAVGRPGRTRTWTTRHGDTGAGGGTPQTVEKVRKRCVQDGFAATLERRKRSRERATVLDGEGEAQLVAIACSDAPAGRTRWTLHMLCDELKRRRVVRSISHETVRKVLKKQAQAVATGDVVYPATAERCLRVRWPRSVGHEAGSVACIPLVVNRPPGRNQAAVTGVGSGEGVNEPVDMWITTSHCSRSRSPSDSRVPHADRLPLLFATPPPPQVPPLGHGRLPQACDPRAPSAAVPRCRTRSTRRSPATPRSRPPDRAGTPPRT